jgi:hypothetical protein
VHPEQKIILLNKFTCFNKLTLIEPEGKLAAIKVRPDIMGGNTRTSKSADC